MALLRRNRTPADPLPSDLGQLLSEYGYYEFDARVAPPLSDNFVNLIVLMQSSTDVANRPEVALEQIRKAAYEAGDWAVFGAVEFIDAFLPGQSGTPVYEELYEARIKYLRSLQMPDIDAYLNGNDRMRWNGPLV